MDEIARLFQRNIEVKTKYAQTLAKVLKHIETTGQEIPLDIITDVMRVSLEDLRVQNDTEEVFINALR